MCTRGSNPSTAVMIIIVLPPPPPHHKGTVVGGRSRGVLGIQLVVSDDDGSGGSGLGGERVGDWLLG